MFGRLQKKKTFCVLFTERIEAVIPSSDSFACWILKTFSGINVNRKRVEKV